MEVDVSCSHVKVELHEKGLSHVDVRGLSELFPITLSHVIIIVSDEELLVLLPQLAEGVGGVFLSLLSQGNFNL